MLLNCFCDDRKVKNIGKVQKAGKVQNVNDYQLLSHASTPPHELIALYILGPGPNN